MPKQVSHDMAVSYTRDEYSRQQFVTGMRRYVLGDLAGHMRTSYEANVKPALERKNGHAPKDGREIHTAMKSDPMFKFYSTVRGATQEMVWRSVMPGIEREAEDLAERAAQHNNGSGNADGTLDINPKFKTPRYISALDVHLMPGCYHTEYFDGDVSQGALYENGLNVFLMGFLGPECDDTGRAVAHFLKERYPDFKPKKMLDIGATIGFHSHPWLEVWPDLEIHAIDVGAPNVRYGHARSQALGETIHWHLMDGADLKFEDETFDIVWSAMVLHEMPMKVVSKVFEESRRVLKPNGLMLHMELPLNKYVEPYEQFYIDWDSYYNKEPFYKSLRDLDVDKAMADAGFEADKLVQFVVPSLHNNGEEALLSAARANAAGVEGNVGKLQGGLKWFTFGAWK